MLLRSASLALIAALALVLVTPSHATNALGFVEFPCRLNVSSQPATSVHRLRPENIQVMGALGDSITAAFGAAASSVVNLATEYRGQSWSIGGDNAFEQTLTLGNIVKKYNPDVRGLSLGTGTRQQNFNVAVSGAVSADIPEQAQLFIDAVRADRNIDFANDWKLLTIWIGGNDFCAICNGNAQNQPANQAAYIEEALDLLDSQVPRLFINLVQVIDVTSLYPVQEGTCVFYHRLVCSCGTDDDQGARNEVTAATKDVHRRLEILANATKYSDRDDFAVVIQPFFIETEVPLRDDGTPDRSWFAPDCFHFAVKGHEAAAVALWNNMLEPVGKKSLAWTVGEPIECPTTERPYFSTAENSL